MSSQSVCAHETAQKVFEDKTYAKVVWRTIPIILLAFICAYYDRVNISFAKLQMQGELGFSDAAYGLGAGLFFIGYFIFEIPSNVIMHRVGAKVWITRIMVTWGLASAAMMFAYNELTFYLLRFFVGAAEAGFAPGVLLYFTYWFPAERRARINSMFILGIVLAGLTGGPVAGMLMTWGHGVWGLSGWQWLFLGEGVPTIVLGVVVFFMLDDNIKSAKWLSVEEKEMLQRNVDKDYVGMKEHASWFAAVKDPSSLYLAVLYFLTMSGLYGFTFWMPQLIKNTGVESPLHVGLLSAIPYVAAAVAMPLASRHSDRTGERKGHLAACLVVCASGYIVSALFQGHTVIALMALTVACMSLFSALPIFWTLPPKFLVGASAASGIAFINSVGNLSGFSSAYIVGKVRDLTGSTAGGLYTVAVICLVGAFVVYFLMPKNLRGMEKYAASKTGTDNTLDTAVQPAD